jgi:homoserine O-acetyltransferase
LKVLEFKKRQGLGVEKNFNSILGCLTKAVPVIQKDLDEGGLKDSKATVLILPFLNRTLQEVKNPWTYTRNFRVANKAVITFPNFGHWSVRSALWLYGRMPKSSELPYEWYNTPNIHLFTLRDFTRMCEDQNLKLKNSLLITIKFSVKYSPQLVEPILGLSE